jgi:hypothetical protein
MARAKAGRPSTYSDEIAGTICDRMAEGESLTSICEDEAMPGRRTVYDWLRDEDHAAFVANFDRARALRADKIFDQILAISDDATNDWMERKGEDNEGWVLNGEHVQRSRLRVDTRKWVLARMDGVRFSDKTRHELTGPNGGPIQQQVEHVPDFAGLIAGYRGDSET